MPKKLRNRFLLTAILLTWLVGGIIAIMGYHQMISAVRREAMARTEDAVRVGQRLMEMEFNYMDPTGPLPADVRLVTFPYREISPPSPLYPLATEAMRKGKADGFVLLEEGLSMVVARRGAQRDQVVMAVRSLRGANWLADQIRNIVFGPVPLGVSAPTVTIFEKDLRIATNVLLPDGRRAVGTKVAPNVAQKVLQEGQTFNDRAFVVDRWKYTCYQPIRTIGGEVIGMLYAGLDEQPYVAEGEKNIYFFILSILTLTLFISIIAWYLGGRLARPLTKVAAAATALSQGGYEPIQVDPTDPEEILSLAVAFNRMSEQIRQRTAELEVSRQKAEKALQDYLEVLGFVAHELKSPISGALTQLMFIEDGFAGKIPESMAKPLSAIHRYLNYGKEMALSFNHLSRAESEGFAPRRRWIPNFYEEVIQPAINDFSPEASQRRMTIHFQGDPGRVFADPDLMRVVMENLLGNAVKYGQEGSEIRITAQETDHSFRVKVWNQGVGVPRERFPDLFAKFSRIQDPKLKLQKGTGVGLYLVKKIVELHGGKVGVEGEYEHWIEFWFEVPIKNLSSNTEKENP
jgi:two-component system NtrC family sensor kinase